MQPRLRVIVLVPLSLSSGHVLAVFRSPFSYALCTQEP